MASPSMLANAVSWATRESLVFRESKFERDDPAEDILGRQKRRTLDRSTFTDLQ